MRVRRRVAVLLAGTPVLINGLINGLLAGLLAGPVTAGPLTDHDVQHRLDQSAAVLEDSTAEVQAAARSLGAVAAQLPAARQEAAAAGGQLRSARADADRAAVAVRRAELARSAAQRRVDEVSARVRAGQDSVGQLARRSYQQGPLGDIRTVFTAQDPQDLVDRSALLEQVFRSQNDSLHQLSVDQLELSRTTAALAVEEQVVVAARRAADDGAARARRVAVRADQAAARVAALVATRRQALASAERARAADRAAYERAQAASRALAARIRAAAKAAAAKAVSDRLAEAERRQLSRGEPAPAGPLGPQSSSGAMAWPASGPLTSTFGYRTHPIFGDARFHAGIDIGAGYGASVVAAADGVVLSAGYAGGYGTLVVIGHGGDLSSAYAHMSSMSVAAGQAVSRGQAVGAVGSEGNSTGPHLHFEVRRGGNPVDPLGYVGR